MLLPENLTGKSPRTTECWLRKTRRRVARHKAVSSVARPSHDPPQFMTRLAFWSWNRQRTHDQWFDQWYTVISACIAATGGYLLFRDSPTTTAEILGIANSDLTFETSSGPLLVVAGLSDEWHVARRRPADSLLGLDNGVLEAQQGTRVRPDDNSLWPLDFVDVQVAIRDFALDADLAEASDTGSPPEDIARRLDGLIDQAENSLMPFGCTMRRADQATTLTDGSVIWGASSDLCEGDRPDNTWTSYENSSQIRFLV